MSAVSVFISYRRDSVGLERASRLHEALRKRGFDVFLDRESIGLGNWKRTLFRQVCTKTHFLLVLTPHCLDRTDDPADIMRLEYEMAERCGNKIVPIYDELPEFEELRRSHSGAMAGIFDSQALQVSLSRFDYDVQRLTQRLAHDNDYSGSEPGLSADFRPATVQGLSAVSLGSQTYAWSHVPDLQVVTCALVIAATIFALHQLGNGFTLPLIGIPITVSVHFVPQLRQPPSHVIHMRVAALIVFVVAGMLVIRELDARESDDRFRRAEWALGWAGVGFAIGTWIALSVSQQPASNGVER